MSEPAVPAADFHDVRPAGSTRTAHVEWPNSALLRETITWLSEGLLEREDHARALLLALLAGEHVLLIGPPGTAKSALARRLHALVGGRWFERLLTRFTLPEELFGPLSLAALDQGRYEREIDAYLPTADVAFVDEIFKANSAILNALLSILNERVFDQGARRIAVPLACLVAASNERPDDDAMQAFQDRFLFRCEVSAVGDESFRALLTLNGVDHAAPRWRVTRPLIEAIDQRCRAIGLEAEVIEALVDLRRRLRESAVSVSDRRWVRAVRVLKVAALLDQQVDVGLEYVPILRWLLPVTPAQVAAFDAWILEWLGVDRTLEPVWLERAVQAFAQQLELEQAAGEIAFDDSGKLALARQLGGADASTLGEGAARLSAFSRVRRYSAAHLEARIAQVTGVIERVDAWLGSSSAHAQALEARLGRVIWLSPMVARCAVQTFQGSIDRVRAARVQLESVSDGFRRLPLAADDPCRSPPPVDIGPAG